MKRAIYTCSTFMPAHPRSTNVSENQTKTPKTLRTTPIHYDIIKQADSDLDTFIPFQPRPTTTELVTLNWTSSSKQIWTWTPLCLSNHGRQWLDLRQQQVCEIAKQHMNWFDGMSATYSSTANHSASRNSPSTSWRAAISLPLNRVAVRLHCLGWLFLRQWERIALTVHG